MTTVADRSNPAGERPARRLVLLAAAVFGLSTVFPVAASLIREERLGAALRPARRAGPLGAERYSPAVTEQRITRGPAGEPPGR
jgi:hypothetical protein